MKEPTLSSKTPQNSLLGAHLTALFTIIVWGSTFIASKIMLRYYQPLAVMTARFAIAWVLLWLLYPKRVRTTPRDELCFLAMGASGAFCYYLCENYALTLTLASNVSIIVAAAPVLTALLAHFFTEEKLTRSVFYGFAVAFFGVALVVFNGTVILKLNPLGDLIALAGALCWAVYSVVLHRSLGRFDALLMTRKMMFYALVMALPLLFITRTPLPLAPLARADVLFCLVFLGVFGSALCYVFWSSATRRLGTVVTNNYIYINPFVTMVVAALVLHEKISVMGVAGAALIIVGVVIGSSGRKGNAHEEQQTEICENPQ